jgi:hypothetical protein
MKPSRILSHFHEDFLLLFKIYSSFLMELFEEAFKKF